MTDILTQTELDHYVGAYGANIENWPEEAQIPARRALESGSTIAPEETVSDAEITAALAVSPPGDLLARRILKAVSEQTQAESRVQNQVPANENTPRARGKLRFGAIAAAALFAIGFVVYPNIIAPSEDEAWLEAASELGFEEVYEWVLSEDT